MPSGQKSTSELEEFRAPIDAPRVREQLQRLLAHPLFANSKRYPALLAYTVEQTLLGNAGELKERSIAVEVFGRAPTYDANADPVVRITAGEVRKRLTQYYYDPSHRSEPVIELPIGSYVPMFRGPERPLVVEPEPGAVLSEEAPAAASQLPPPAQQRHTSFMWWAGAGMAVLVAAAAVTGWIASRQYHEAAPPPSNVDRFWAPVTGSLNPTTFCLGEPAKNIDLGAVNSY